MVTVHGFTNTEINNLPNEVGNIVYNINDKLLYYCDSFGFRPLVSFKSTIGAGVNTNNPITAFDINAADGDCLRLIYNDSTGNPTTFSDFNLTSTGNLIFEGHGSNPKFTFLNGGIEGTILTLSLIHI
jgi:hypothetical protein